MRSITKYPITLLLAVFPIIIVLHSCSKPYDEDSLSDKKEITSFIFLKTDNAGFLTNDITATIGTDTISAWVPAETNITNLKATIVHNGKTISPDPGSNRDFSMPVVYQVMAGDGTTHSYTVKISKHKPLLNTANRIVYFGDDEDYFFALDALTGQEIWKKKLWHPTRSAPLLHKGTVYIQHVWQQFSALDGTTGTQKWITGFYGGIGGSPLMYNDELFAVSSNNIYKLDTGTGFVKWRYFPNSTNTLFQGSPTIAHGNLYIDSVFDMMALDLASGAVKWKRNLGGSFIGANPLILGDLLYVAGGGYFYALNAHTGEIVWKTVIGLTYSSATAANGLIYIAGRLELYELDWYICALDATNGALKWKTPTGKSLYSSPTVAKDVVYYGNEDSKLYAYNAITGELKWTFTTGDDLFGSATVANDIIYIGCVNRNLYALDARTGEKIWVYAAPNPILGHPSVVDSAGKVYYPSTSGMKN
ncbi:PQQ-binding-like beta-propeller repeat protein [Pseudoflavitalea sp. X16]|nr:PQQ-binding-like beta-propeller repeat protein [Paraflavitalea devenefica]